MTQSLIVFTRCFLFFGLLLSYSVQALINVNTTSNAVANDGQCSLPEAILTANSNTDSGNMPSECQGSDDLIDEIYLVAGIYFVNIDLPIITQAVSIHGDTSNTTIIDGSSGAQLFQVDIPSLDSDPVVAFYDVTVANATGEPALTIVRSDTVFLIRTQFRLNQAGAVKSLDGFLNVVNSNFSNNSNSENGGAICAEDQTTTVITSSTFSFNKSSESGGALAISGNTSSSFMRSSTFSGNEADDNGGAIAILNSAFMFMFSSTLTKNIADADADNSGNGAAVYVGITTVPSSATSASFENSVLAGNIDQSNTLGTKLGDIARFDGDSILTSRGYNFIGNNNDAGPDFPLSNDINTPNDNEDIVGFGFAPFDPQLDILQDNGGPTLTHLPIFNSQIVSPLIDAGQCNDIQPNGTADQRDLVDVDDRFPIPRLPDPMARIYDEPSIENLHPSGCDIGAVELKERDIANELCIPILANTGGIAVICL